MDKQFEKFIKDINFLMGKLIPQNWKVVELEPNKPMLNIIIPNLEISDLTILYTYKFTMNELNQLYAMSKYGNNVSNEEKITSIKKATIAAFRKMKNWTETVEEKLTQNEFVMIAISEIRRRLSDEWIIKPITLDDKIYSEINFKYNKQSTAISIELDYIKFKRGSKTLSETIKRIANEGKKQTMKKVNISKNDDLFISMQDEMEDIRKEENKFKKETKKGREKKRNITTTDASNSDAFTQAELEKMIFG